MGTCLERLKEHWARISRMEQAINVLAWDMETYMPEEGVRARAGQISLMTGLAHRWLIDPETGRMIDGAEKETAGGEYFSDDVSMARAARRLYDRQARLPEELVVRMAGTAARANSIWAGARKNSDFGSFAPILSELIDLNREQADRLGWRGHPYDALLDLYEPGMTTLQVDGLFTELKGELIPLVREITGRKNDMHTDFLNQKFDTGRQEAFGLQVLGDMRYDFRRGRQDRSAHPFTTSFSPFDVRITTRFSEDDPLSALFSTVHEGGHALYEQGLPLDLVDTPLCQPISLGVHESQSRLWENIVARSLPFWRHYLPVLRDHFPGQLDACEPETFYRAANKVHAGLIRVESDELTYNLHIFIRFELEKEIIGGRVDADGIPSLWNQKYREYLGIEPPDDAHGCLQDIHWAHGSFGYFPTYTIGNVLSAQLYQAAVSDHPSIPDDIGRGRFDALLTWLRDRVHRPGARYTPEELVREATGVPIRIGPYMEYLENKFRGM